MTANKTKRSLALILAMVLLFSAVPLITPASAATSSSVASAFSGKLPLVTYAMPLSGATRVYSYASTDPNALGSLTNSYYIDTFVDQIVIRRFNADGTAVEVTYPSGSTYRTRWYRTEDIIGTETINILSYTASAKYTTYRMSSASSVVSYGSIAKNDACTTVGTHTINGKTYYPTVYPISSKAYNNVSGVKYKLALSTYSPEADLIDVTAQFAGKKISFRSVENGKYLCADTDVSGNPVVANRTKVASWEIFEASALQSDGCIGFKAHNGKYLSVQADNSKYPLVAKYGDLLTWERFRIFQRDNDYYLKADINNKWVCVRINEGGVPVRADVNAASTWERLAITVHDSTQYAPYKGVDYTTTLKNAYSSGRIGSTEYNNRITLLNEAKKMVTVLWTAPVSFHTWRAGSGSYNKNGAMLYNCSTSSTTQFVKGYTYQGIPYSTNVGSNNYNAASWLALINQSGIATSTLEGTVTYLGVTRYNTTSKGVDCSGFVYNAYLTIGNTTRQSTSGMLNSSLWKKISASDALPGDILLKNGHVMIYLGKTSSGRIAVFESVADGANGTSGCRYYTFSSVSSYGYYRYTGIAS